MKTDDFFELSALHKAILAAKFSTFPDPKCAEITSSPILAGLSNDIYDEMCKLQEKKMKGMGKEWQDWRRVKDSHGFRGQWRIAVMAARRDRFFMSASHEDKITGAKCLLSPFTCTDEELDEFLRQVANSSNNRLETLFKEHSLAGATFCSCSYNEHVSGGDARLVLGLKKGGNCDIFFGGVRSYRISKESVSDISDTIPVLKKHTVSSGSLEKLDAVFEYEKCKQSLFIEAETVDYWL